MTITSSEGPEQTHDVRDQLNCKGENLYKKFNLEIHFTSLARNDGARLERISEMDVVAGRLYVSCTHTSCSPPGAVSALFEEHAID